MKIIVIRLQRRLLAFDLALTSRHYNYWYKVNGGVWALKYNNKTEQFLKFYVKQMLNPDWQPFVAFQQRFKHKGKLDWYCDQDFLCTVFENKLPFDCNVIDLGYKYNYCPSVEREGDALGWRRSAAGRAYPQRLRPKGWGR